MRALELFCGIGGFTAAADRHGIEVVRALDASQHVIAFFRHNWDAPAKQANILQLGADDFAAFEADLWWMSPPCQPYTTRGLQRDLSDRRAKSFLHMLEVIEAAPPRHLAMENVEGFLKSEARTRLLELLERLDFDVREAVICPTELGLINRRPRYYLVASRDGLTNADLSPVAQTPRLIDLLDAEVAADLWVAPEDVAEYGHGFDIVDADTPDAVTSCFTSAYGKSWIYSGSYLRQDGRIRRFSPDEILRLMQFPAHVSPPPGLERRKAYKYIGNSLAIEAVYRVLGCVQSS
jgi:site-specific DNA-cytosine methylase